MVRNLQGEISITCSCETALYVIFKTNLFIDTGLIRSRVNVFLLSKGYVLKAG